MEEAWGADEGPPAACCRGAARGAVPPALALLLLAAARAASAAWNIIHDCDETFNYLEPLHYLLFGSGLQTWEYGAQFALRSYLYLLLHGVVAAPVAAVLGAGAGGRGAQGWVAAAAAVPHCKILGGLRI